MRISSGVIQNNSDNPPNLAGTDSNAKGIRGEGEKLKLWRLLSASLSGAKWDVCPVYHLWEPVRQVCALLLRWFILTPFYWPPLGIRLTSFSWCFCAGLCRRIVALQVFNVQPFVWNGSVKGLGETHAGEWARGLGLFKDFISTKDDWKVRKYLEKVRIWVHWCIDSCNVVVCFWLLQLYLFTFQLSCMSLLVVCFTWSTLTVIIV